MFKPNFVMGRLPACFCASILLLLAAWLLPLPIAQAQNCGTGFGGDIAVSPSTAHVGDTVTINFLELFSSLNTCTVTNGRAWIIYPDNTVQLWLNDFILLPNSTILCPSGPACLPFSLTYIIKPADVQRSLSFATNFPAGFNTRP